MPKCYKRTLLEVVKRNKQKLNKLKF